MGSAIFSAASGAKSQARYLDIIANNLANASTVAYKADDLRFADFIPETDIMAGFGGGVLSDEAAPAATNLAARNQHYVRIVGQTVDLNQGNLKETGNDLDLALHGEAFFQVRIDDRIAYTRDGRFKVNEDGELLHISGGRVLDDGGSPIRLEQGPVEISDNGAIKKDGEEIANLGLKYIPESDDLKKIGNSMFEYTKTDRVPDNAEKVEVMQGYLESSNVNPIREMTKMIKVNRHFDIMNKAIKAYKELDERSIMEIGNAGGR